MNQVLLIIALLSAALLALHLFAPVRVAQTYLAAARMHAGMSTGVVEVSGQQFSYLEGGSGPVVVLVHGFGGDSDNWLLLAKSLTRQYRVIAPDLPGFGASPAPVDKDFSVNLQAERLAAFVAAVAPVPAHFAGNSMGGQIVTVLAARHPELVKTIALLNPLGVESEPGVRASPTMLALAQGSNLMLPQDDEAFAKMMGVMFYRQPWVPAVVRNYYRQRWLENGLLLAEVFADISAQYVPLRPLLPAIKAPALIIWGAEDKVLPADGAAKLAEGLPDSEVVIIPDCGHLPMIEKPGVTAARYRAFLNRYDAR